MSHTPKSINTLNEAMGGLMKKLIAAGATNVSLVSIRSLRFDLPADKTKDGINRVKLTARENGTVDIRFIEVIERDLVGGVQTDKVAECLKNFTGLDLS